MGEAEKVRSVMEVTLQMLNTYGIIVALIVVETPSAEYILVPSEVKVDASE